MAKSLDLNKIKDEIDSRKKERNMVSSKLGETVGRGVAPRDEFLNGLLTSLHTGRETSSSSLIKLVENKVAIKNKEAPKYQVNETPQPVQSTTHRPVQSTAIEMSPERDDKLWEDIEKRKKQTLAESLQQYIGAPSSGAPMLNQPTQPSSQLNEGYLVENVKKIVNNYLVENFGPVLEEAIKSTIIEMYAVERIKEVIQENKEMIKSVVYETIKELQNKAKAKQEAQK
jgi:hypothetical protein